MFRYVCLLVLFATTPSSILSQQVTISGYIVDSSTEEKLIGCNILDTLLTKGTVSNNYGFFSYSSKEFKKDLCFSYVGYQSACFLFQGSKDTSVLIRLNPLVELDGVVVIADKDTPEKEEMSVHFLQIKDVKILPTVSGEVDLMKSLQMLPGVQSGSEGQTGLYVRGGSPDQNLILIDDIPIYYASHALGFLSVFNADAIRNVSLTKGAFPARFGGRLSSVLEVRMKEGNLKKTHAEGAIGLIASKITVEGPIKKEKTSFIVSARRTYLDILARPIIKKFANSSLGGKVKPSVYFYDLNSKVRHILNEKNSLYLSTYLGADKFSFKYKNKEDEYGGGVGWKNSIVSLRWNKLWNNKLFSNTTLYYTKYNIEIASSFNYTRDEEKRIYSSTYLSGIRDVGIKFDFDFIPKAAHYIKFGGSIVAHQYKPGAVNINSIIEEIGSDTIVGTANINNIENDLYIEDEMTCGKFRTNIGLHASLLNTGGEQFVSLQPRMLVSFKWNENLFLKGSYSRTSQYINLLTSDILNLPSDIWVPSTKNIKPQFAHQYAFGISSTLSKKLKISIEGYYKQMKNLLAYKEGTSFDSGAGENWESAVTQGNGEAYGMEFFLQKTKGKTTGWIGYTLSWNWRTFTELNGGRQFPYRYDRRHDISLFLSHKLNEKIKVSAVWIFSTGNATTLPAYRYAENYSSSWSDFEQRLYEFYGGILKVTDKNSFRLSSYHRLDLSMEFFKKKKRFERTWKISTYNTYFHSNPYIILPSYIRGKMSLKEISLLPFLIPSVSYQFKF